jgi:hypothetical protein
MGVGLAAGVLQRQAFIPRHDEDAGRIIQRTNQLLSGTWDRSSFDNITDKVSGGAHWACLRT